MPVSDGEWSDWLGQQRVACEVRRPAKVDAVFEAVEEAVRTNRRIRAVGSGHSTSDVARPPSDAILLSLEHLALDDADWKTWLKGDLALVEPRVRPGEQLVRVSSGQTIRALNLDLAKRRLAMPNLGSYDGQSIYGAIATGTHGTGLGFGPLADLVSSIEMIGVEDAGRPVVRHWRIEPTNGITDRDRFYGSSQRGRMSLVQDDEVFRSVVVGLGCFGIVTAITLRVVPAFQLRETCEVVPWSSLKSTLVSRARSTPWLDVTMLPERLDGEHWCQVTVREKRPALPHHVPLTELPPRGDARIREARTREGKEQSELVCCALAAGPLGTRIATQKLRELFREDATRTIESESYVVFRTSVGDWIPATSSEIGVDVGRSVAAIDATIAHLDAMASRGFFHVSPLGIRFSRASSHYLAMQYGRDTCTIEAPIPVGNVNVHAIGSATAADAAPIILGSFERTLIDPRFEGRPHWGQRHTVSGGFLLRYPKGPSWARQLARFNRFGLFDNAFTGRMALRR
ncbi:Hypothetical protein I5071_46550 [Sandaracinus amylolyticus]|nr:Hypothetical protein I5071_46550 [Sandaracinus amylolyticus]